MERSEWKFSGVISALRNGDVELQLDGQHEIHHFQRADAKIAQLSVQRKRGGHTALWPQERL